ncbi:MAG: alpha/beta hydrolase [Chloroflexaceae bacterium]|nr:alpha/beta hydrolase [Chloroflexaceae bacterium]
MQKQGTLLEWLALAVIVLLIIGGMGFVALRMVIAPRMATPPAPAPAAVAQAEPTATALADAIATDTPPTPTTVPTPQPTPLPVYEPRFAVASCPFEPESDATIECGYLVVPEDRTNADSPEIELAVAIIRSPDPAKAPDPILYLEGGPGGTALYTIDRWVQMGLASNRDVIVMDQRGTGFSRPTLDCPKYPTGHTAIYVAPNGSCATRCSSAAIAWAAKM